jgi:hypothetical protein
MDLSRALGVVSQYTADQWGLVTAAQAKAVGVGAMTLARLVDAGLLERVRHGCYLSTSAPAQPHVRERAAWLLLNPTVPAWERPRLDPDGGVLSHSSATVLHELGDLLGETVEITVPRRRVTREPGVRMRLAALTEDEVTLVDGLPVTTVERTILDLLGDHLDGGHIGQVIYDTLVAGQVDPKRLIAGMGGFARRYGIAGKDGRALLEDLLVQAGHRPEDLNRPRVPHRAVSHPLTARDLLPPSLLTSLSEANRRALNALRPAVSDLTGLRSTLASMNATADFRSLLNNPLAGHRPLRKLIDLPTLQALGISTPLPRGEGFVEETTAGGDDKDDDENDTS